MCHACRSGDTGHGHPGKRSDQDFDNPGFEEIMFGEATAKRLEQVMRWRDEDAVPDEA
jgi:hypothetical protein